MTKPVPTRQVYITLILLGLVAYAPILQVGFLWDDHVLIEQNPYIREWSWANVKHDFSSTVSNGYGDQGFLRPIVTLSNRLDYAIWGLRPFGYHLTGLAIHIANAFLLYELILLLGCTPMAALLAACLFVVHPIDVEGLITVTGRATFLSFFFGLGTLILLADPSPERAIGGLFCFALALLSKEQSIIVPFLAALVWTVRRGPRRRFLLLIPMAVLLGLYLAYRHSLFGTMGGPMERWYTLRFLMEAFPRILSHYVGLILVPWNLHSHRLIARMSHFWFLSFAGWAAAAGWAAYKREAHPLAFFCVFWFLAVFLPPCAAMLNGGFMLDHWGYWAAPAILIPLGIGFDRAWTQRSKPYSHAVALCFFPLLIFYALLVRLNVELRGTDEKMYRWALHFTTSHPIKYNLGILLLETGRAPEAIEYLEDVRAAYPEDRNNLRALSMAYALSGHPKIAKRLLKDPFFQIKRP